MALKPLCLTVLFCAFLSACTTTPPPDTPLPNTQGTGISDKTIADIGDDGEDATQTVAENNDTSHDNERHITINPPQGIQLSRDEDAETGFADLNLWGSTDPSPALHAFQQTCKAWAGRDPHAWVSENQPVYGRYIDWQRACDTAQALAVERETAMAFFEQYFAPVTSSKASASTGLMTGYYIPLIEVKSAKGAEFYEPILENPGDPKLQALPRGKVSEKTAKVIAYGRPIDVFFMQVQGSGRLQFEDGRIVRAAFDGHNSQPYKSIGRVLIKRGELSRHKASKQDLTDWMEKAGPKKTKALLSENPRYVYFRLEKVEGELGPKGSMGVPLSAMGSVAIDPSFYPYGTLHWVETRLPTGTGDYTGEAAGLLLAAQDTGGAIKGEGRGDIFYGFGASAGEKAGVMKHEGRWTILLPTTLIPSGEFN